MTTQLKASGRFATLALVAVLIACTAEVPETAPDSAVSDRPSVGNQAGADPQRSDTAVPPEQTLDAEPREDLLTPDGWGPLRIGMSRAEVVAAAGEDANPDAVGGAEPDQCDQFRPRSAPDGVLVMIESGVLTRISVSRSSNIGTPEGFRVGDSGSEVIAKLGTRALVEPHKFWESPAKTITIWREQSPDANRRGIRYEVDPNDEIVHIHAGGSSIEYVEGCS